MNYLYWLEINTFPNGDQAAPCGIGLFLKHLTAEDTARRYLSEVQGFSDYYCEPNITKVPVSFHTEHLQKVWAYTGWNWDEYGDEIDILPIACFPSEGDALSAMESAKTATPRQEWSCDSYIIDQCHWEEGFIRDYPSGRIAPTLLQVQDFLTHSMSQRKACSVEFHYDDLRYTFFPLSVGRDLFLAAEEDDFLLDGYTIRRIRDVYDIHHTDGLYQHIFEREGITAQLQTPKVDISSWKTVFLWLNQQGNNIIIERQHPREDGFFLIGRIVEIHNDHLLIRVFDADGIWENPPRKISYADITSVSFDTRYISTFSKYI